MYTHIALQSTYQSLEIALFNDKILCDFIQEDKQHTSSLLIPRLQQLLERNNLALNDISFCTVNCGPAPFSSLRSVIASANGLFCATKIPLISVDGLKATFLELYDPAYEYTIVLLNAFNNELYYLLAQEYQIIQTGYKESTILLQEFKNKLPSTPIHFFGNGVALHKKLIEEIFGENAIINNSIEYCSIKQIGLLGLQKFESDEYLLTHLLPLYLKKHPVEKT